MLIVLAIIGVVLISIVLLDAFETVVLPRRVMQSLRISRLLYQVVWKAWLAIGRRMRNPQSFLAFFGPLSLILLLAIWAVVLVFGFALLHKAAEADPAGSFWHYLYVSGTTFFTVGNSVSPSPLGRVVTVAEGATGFSFLAIIIGYLPVFYQTFSQRERQITLLDARAGSPPSAVEFLRRQCKNAGMLDLDQFFIEWEHWAAELLESHLSYPILGLFRSQHENESWLAALTMMLDVSALVIATCDERESKIAALTFAIGRHAAVDLCQVYNSPPKPLLNDRMLPAALVTISHMLGDQISVSEDRLTELRAMYEPYVNALSNLLLMPLPVWVPKENSPDNWETTAWGDVDGVIL